MSHTPPDLANLSPFKINTPSRNAIEQEAQELLGNVELNVDGPAIEEVLGDLQQDEVVQNDPEIMHDAAAEEVMQIDAPINVADLDAPINVVDLDAPINVVDVGQNEANIMPDAAAEEAVLQPYVEHGLQEEAMQMNVPEGNETVEWELEKIILKNGDKYLCQWHGSSMKTFEPACNINETELFKKFVQPDVFVVDRIFLRRRKNRRIEYLVEWTGGERSWVKRQNISHLDLLKDFESANPPTPKKKVKKIGGAGVLMAKGPATRSHARRRLFQ